MRTEDRERAEKVYPKNKCLHFRQGYCVAYRKQCKDHDPCDTWEQIALSRLYPEEEESNANNDRNQS